jgi:hypothetical protein
MSTFNSVGCLSQRSLHVCDQITQVLIHDQRPDRELSDGSVPMVEVPIEDLPALRDFLDKVIKAHGSDSAQATKKLAKVKKELLAQWKKELAEDKA